MNRILQADVILTLTADQASRVLHAFHMLFELLDEEGVVVEDMDICQLHGVLVEQCQSQGVVLSP